MRILVVDEGKYYEANLVLKSIEDSVITEIVDADATPSDSDQS